MSGKSNSKVWRWGMVVVLLLSGAGWFLYSKWGVDDKKVDEPKQQYAQSNIPIPRNVNAAGTAAMATQEPNRRMVDTLNLTFRAVGLNRVSTEADQELAFNVLSEMKKSPYFDSSQTLGVGEVSPEVPLSEPPVKPGQGEPPGTFSFKIVAKLKRPLTL
jgi:hypothetical protein